MKYDRDIRYGRWAFWLLAVANFCCLILNLLAHNWIIASACALWLFNVLRMAHSLKIQQLTRDHCRTVEAGLYRQLRADGWNVMEEE